LQYEQTHNRDLALAYSTRKYYKSATGSIVKGKPVSYQSVDQSPSNTANAFYQKGNFV
jgi:hypothetical protein